MVIFRVTPSRDWGRLTIDKAKTLTDMTWLSMAFFSEKKSYRKFILYCRGDPRR
jgi:hypothetical protein